MWAEIIDYCCRWLMMQGTCETNQQKVHKFHIFRKVYLLAWTIYYIVLYITYYNIYYIIVYILYTVLVYGISITIGTGHGMVLTLVWVWALVLVIVLVKFQTPLVPNKPCYDCTTTPLLLVRSEDVEVSNTVWSIILIWSWWALVFTSTSLYHPYICLYI